MKFNKWTLGLAALGVVSLATAVKADNTAPAMIETAVSGTTISGYVNTSAQWNVNNNGNNTGGNSLPGYAFNNLVSGVNSKADGFNLDAIKIGISKAMDESEWASGYNIELVNGQDGLALNSFGGFGIKQAYVSLRTPIGNGIDWKIGVFDTIIGYEVFDAGGNANYTRSYGYTIEPTTHEGILASYKFADWISAQAGVANTTGYSVYLNRTGQGESSKTFMGSIALTAPQSWGVLAGSQLYGGAILGRASAINGALSGSQNALTVNYYAGAVVNTGVKGLKVGASYDYAGRDSHPTQLAESWANAAAIYASFQATEKLSLHARAEYAWSDAQSSLVPAGSATAGIYAVTGTIQYDLWKNVMSRLEIRWDHSKDQSYGQTLDKKDNVLVAANVIYKF